MVIACKACRKVFRRPPIDEWEDSDEYCPHCDAHLLVEPVTPQVPRGLVVQVEGDGQTMDERVKQTKPPMAVDLNDLDIEELLKEAPR
jgi:hypothetical protein